MRHAWLSRHSRPPSFLPGCLQALELVYGEMRRSDLTPSMRCGLLNATAPLCALREVAQFWEQCAALHDKEVRCTCGRSVPALSFAPRCLRKRHVGQLS